MCLVRTVLDSVGGIISTDRVAGAYILYTHMMAQRRKIMRGDAAKKSK